MAKLFIFLGAVAIGSIPVAGFGKNDPAREVRAVVERLSQAGLRRDVTAIDEIYAPDYFHTNPDGSLMSRTDVLASYRAETPFAFDSSRADDEHVLVHRGCAIVNERLTLHGEKKGAGKFTSRYRVTYVLVMRGGVWKVWNSHSSLLGIEPEDHAK